MIIRHRGRKFVADQRRLKDVLHTSARANPLVWVLYADAYADPQPEREYLGHFRTQKEMRVYLDTLEF